VGGEHSSKELFKQLVNSYSEPLHELAKKILDEAGRKSYSRVGNTAYLAVECFVGDPLLTLLHGSQDYAVRSVDQFNSKPE
jgi:hypothetical protein